MIKGVVFDFNGTLFWDSQLHMDVWREFSKNLRDIPFTDEEMLKHMFGRTNEYILKYLTGETPSKELIEKSAKETEKCYQNMCRENKDKCKLANGAIEFLDFLKENNIPRAIATMSEWANVKFYIKEFNLEKWFDIDNIVYSNGKIPGKPAPDIFNIAIEKLNLSPQDVLIIEDAISRLEAAKRANAGEIIAIASREAVEYYKNLDYVSQIITNFNQIDKNIFLM